MLLGKVNFLSPVDKILWVTRIIDFNQADYMCYRPIYFTSVLANRMLQYSYIVQRQNCPYIHHRPDFDRADSFLFDSSVGRASES